MLLAAPGPRNVARVLAAVAPHGVQPTVLHQQHGIQPHSLIELANLCKFQLSQHDAQAEAVLPSTLGKLSSAAERMTKERPGLQLPAASKRPQLGAHRPPGDKAT